MVVDPGVCRSASDGFCCEPRHAPQLAAALEEALAVDAAAISEPDAVRAALPRIAGAARETLRLYPPVPFVGRTGVDRSPVATGGDGDGGAPPPPPPPPFEVGGRSLPDDAVLCWSPWFLGRDPSSWGGAASAAAFEPARWVESPATGGAPSTFCWLPFGAGPRGCLGTRLGLTEASGGGVE